MDSFIWQEFQLDHIADELNRIFPTATFSFEILMERLLAGDVTGAFNLLSAHIWDVCGTGLTAYRNLFLGLLVLGIFGALVNNLSDVFNGSQVAEMGEYLFLLMTALLLVKYFEQAGNLAVDTAKDMVLFHKLLIPTYLLAVGACVGTTTMEAYEGLFLLGIYGVERFLLGLIIPLIRTYFLLAVLGSVWKEERLSPMLELLAKGIGWIQKTLLGLVSGLGVLQALLTPAVDSVKMNALQRILRLIPGAGSLSEGTLSMLSGSAFLIKNSLGVGLLLLLLFLCAVPLIKLFLGAMVLKLSAAVMGLFADKGLYRCVDRCGEAGMMLFRTVAYGMFLFMISLATVVAVR